MTTGDWITALVAIAGALGVRELIARMIDRRAGKVASDKVVVETAKTEVETIRAVLQEVRIDSEQKTTKLHELERRIDALEERERHALTRAAVHEAWDQMAFQVLVAMNPQHPPPPPLTGVEGSTG